MPRSCVIIAEVRPVSERLSPSTMIELNGELRSGCADLPPGAAFAAGTSDTVSRAVTAIAGTNARLKRVRSKCRFMGGVRWTVVAEFVRQS